jgi:DNA-binding response OmpR family regulator
MIRPKKTSVLIVEDEALLLQALVDAFTAEDFEVMAGRNGEEGLEVAFRKHPDIILLDIIMPKMDGMTMLNHLRADTWGQDVPVIILTNLSDYTSVADALQHGVHDFLVKSNWTIDDVIKKVKDKLKLEP